jgi:transcriptional regulator with XRE-family HTH domain
MAEPETPNPRAPKRPLDHDPQAVKEARELRGMTRTEVAEKLGVSLSLISEIEKGTRNAGPAMTKRLAGVLRVPARTLRRPGVISTRGIAPREPKGVAA